MQDESGVVLIQDVSARAETIIIDVSLGPNGGHVNVAEPWPSDAAGGGCFSSRASRGPCLDLVVCGLGPSLLESVAPGDAIPAPGSLGDADLGALNKGCRFTPMHHPHW
jgi:hypothetical protein